MEVRETAACGISLREFAIEFDPDELAGIYRIFVYAQDGTGFYDEDFLEELKSQMSYIIGPSLEEKPQEDLSEKGIHWEDTGTSFNLNLNEPEAGKLFQILNAVDHPGKDFDKGLNQNLMEQMIDMAPTALENLPTINR